MAKSFLVLKRLSACTGKQLDGRLNLNDLGPVDQDEAFVELTQELYGREYAPKKLRKSAKTCIEVTAVDQVAGRTYEEQIPAMILGKDTVLVDADIFFEHFS